MCRKYKFRKMRLTKSFVMIRVVWCKYIWDSLFSIIYSIPILQFRHRAYTIRVKIAKAELTVIFFCSCISVCAKYSALQIFHEETLGLFTSCFAFMIPSCICLQMKSEKRKVKREVTGIFNEILSKPLFRYQSRFVKRQKSKYVSSAQIGNFFLLLIKKERKSII